MVSVFLHRAFVPYLARPYASYMKWMFELNDKVAAESSKLSQAGIDMMDKTGGGDFVLGYVDAD